MAKVNDVSKARARLLLQSAFFGTILVTSPMIERHDIPTAATDMRNIYYNPAFFDGMPVEEIMGVLAHEVLHIALEHGLRRGGRDPRLWNIACDYAINLILIECGFVLPKGGLYDVKYKGMSAEQIYALLEKERDKHGKQQSGQGQPQQGRGQGQPQSGQGNGPDPSDLFGGMGQDLIEPDMTDKAEVAKLKDEVRSKIVQATTMGRMAGNTPAGLLRAMDDLIHPPVPWQDLMRPLMTSFVKDDENWSYRNRRFANVYLPARHSERIGLVAVIGDTSGSITNDELKSVGGSVVDIAEEVTPEVIHVLWADSKVAGEQVFECGDPIKLDPKGGGGTDMRVPLARAAELDPAVVVLITDGHTPWPDVAPDYPLIVLCTTKVNVPFGEVIRL